MSVTRACKPCRDAKAKCDLVRPACSRCTRRGIDCSGFPDDAGFIFLNENVAAQRNSRRARGERGQDPVNTTDRRVQQDRQLHQASDMTDEFWRQQYPWLNARALGEAPEPLKRDIETRAVERFFVNWILYPSNHGVSTGYMYDLPRLYLGEQPGSVLWHAVRAIAFADMKKTTTGRISFSIKAQQQYGSALNGMRIAIGNQEDLSNDTVLSAVLLIDNFEQMYLARTDPLGSHSTAIRHILHSRGEMQLYNPTRFSLWRLAHYRLQAWQTLLREHPGEEQIAWIEKLNINRPDDHICVDCLHMNILSATAREITRKTIESETQRLGFVTRAQSLVQEMQDRLAIIEKWSSEMAVVWKPTVNATVDIVQPQDVDELPDVSTPLFPFPHVLSYNDIWLAYLWNFFAASQIVLRESMVDMINHTAMLQLQFQPDIDKLSIIDAQQKWIDILSTTIMESFPILLGYTLKHQYIGGPRQGRMAGRLFSIFSMRAIEQSKYASEQHKKTATEVINWVNSQHGLS